MWATLLTQAQHGLSLKKAIPSRKIRLVRLNAAPMSVLALLNCGWCLKGTPSHANSSRDHILKLKYQ